MDFRFTAFCEVLLARCSGLRTYSITFKTVALKTNLAHLGDTLALFRE